MPSRTPRTALLPLPLVLLAPSLLALAQAPAPLTFTADQIHQNMMDQLGITALRPGPSGNEKAPDHANYDESLANPYPDLPDALTFPDGHPITTASEWWSKRRPQIVAAFEHDVYGSIPTHTPDVHWRVVATDHETLGGTPVLARQLIGHVDNSAYPQISVNLRMTLVTPTNISHPVPVLIMFGRSAFPAPVDLSADELDRVNAAERSRLIKEDPSLQQVFDTHQAWQPFKAVPLALPQFNADGDPPSDWELVAAGWGFASLDPASIQADNGEGLTRGIIGLVNHGQPRTPEQWGALRAWGWGASRAFDHLATLPEIDAKHIGIEGVSRYGKAALVTMAFDQRFAMALVGSSGKGGTTPFRRNYGEAVETLTGGEYYWFTGNFLHYGASASKSGPGNASQLPVDSNELIALCAPRLTFISYGIPEKGDAHWLDHQGSYMATVAAQPVFELLGGHGLGVPADYKVAQMPPVNHGLLDGQLAWRQDDGGHTDAPNMKYFIQWVDKNIHDGDIRNLPAR